MSRWTLFSIIAIAIVAGCMSGYIDIDQLVDVADSLADVCITIIGLIAAIRAALLEAIKKWKD